MMNKPEKNDWPTRAETETLRFVRSRGWSTMNEIVTGVDRAHGTVHGHLQSLEQKGFLTRRSGEKGYEFAATQDGGFLADIAKDLKIGERE